VFLKGVMKIRRLMVDNNNEGRDTFSIVGMRYCYKVRYEDNAKWARPRSIAVLWGFFW
jgi:hypothetical protein